MRCPSSFHCEVEGARHTPPLVAIVSTQQHFNFSADIFQADLEMLAAVSVACGKEEKEVTPPKLVVGSAVPGTATILSGSLVPHTAASMDEGKVPREAG